MTYKTTNNEEIKEERLRDLVIMIPEANFKDCHKTKIAKCKSYRHREDFAQGSGLCNDSAKGKVWFLKYYSVFTSQHS